MIETGTAGVSPLLHDTRLGLEEPYGWNARIGLIVLSSDPVIERDFHRLAPDDSVGVFSTRVYLERPNSDRTFLALADELEPAASLIIPDSRLDAIVFGCTSASTLIGPERIAELVRRGRPGIPVTNPATAALAALRRLEARRVALVTPYTQQMTGNVMRFLAEGGLACTSVRCAGYDTDHAIGSIPAAFFVEAAKASKLQGADAIFISCTGTKALNVIDDIETETGLPVVVSNQAAFWHALGLSGWKAPVSGYGKLLREMW